MPARPPARSRLLAAADKLFYDEGVHTVGVDRIIEHAGVAKASLYSTFGSKEALIRAYLDSRRADMSTRLHAAIAQHTDPVARALAVFDVQATLFAEPGFRGCPFVAASAEAPAASEVARAAADYRRWLRGLFTSLCEAAGAHPAHEAARKLQLLYDGAALTAHMDRDPDAARTARALALAVLTTHATSH